MRSLSSLLPALVAAVSLGVTGWLWHHERQADERGLRASFDFGLHQTAGRIEQRLASYEQMLRGAQGMYQASERFDAHGLGVYVDALLAGTDFPSVQSIAYAPYVPADRLEPFLAEQRAAGHADFELKPPGARAAYAPIVCIAPAAGPRGSAIGRDPYADPARRVAMDRARDSGGIAVTDRLDLREAEAALPQYGFLMVLPLYRSGAAVNDVASRRANLNGWVMARLRMSELMSSLYGDDTPGLEVSIHDGTQLSAATLMYASGAPTRPAAEPARFEAQEYIGVAGHSWTLLVRALPEFEQRHRSDGARIIAVAGAGLSLLLALLTHQLVTGRSRAHAMAGAMTRELRDSEARYRRIVETADEGIWMTDADARTSFVNPKMAHMLGCEASDIVGRPMTDFLQCAPERVREPGAMRELAFRRTDGSVLWASISASAIVDAGGGHAGLLAMVTDISARVQAESDRQQLETQLRESQKMEAIGTLAGGIAHDFNNILPAILGHTALAQEELATGHAALPHLQQIELAGGRARSLVQQILAFSRKQPHLRVTQPLRPLLEESVRLLRPVLPALVQLELRLGDTPLHASVDATQLQQVVMNLCTNAWHALDGRAGRIELGLAFERLEAGAAPLPGGLPPGRYARLWVGDDGSGMDEATLARVFEPFFTTKPVGQGTGLGLSVVHGIVAMHDGAITVESTPGAGSTFCAYFPLQLPAAAAAAPEASAPPSDGAAGRHVLYVDDDPIMGLMVQGLLQRSGYRTTCFDDPREALAALRGQPGAFDLVVTDFNMPALSGMDVAQEVARTAPGLPVVITSGYLSEDVRAAAQQAGVRGLLQKEYTLEQLDGIVRRVLAEADLESR